MRKILNSNLWMGVLITLLTGLIIWAVFFIESDNQKIAVFAIVGVLITAITSVVTVNLSTQKAKEKEYELMLVKEKQKVFNHFFNVLFEIIISSKEHRKTNMPLVIKEYMNFKRGLMIWGSEEAINSFITFDRVFQNLSKEGNLDENEKIASLSVIEIILKSIRKDLKYSVSDKIFLTGVLLGIKEQQILKNL